MCKDVGGFTTKSIVCVKIQHNISHLPLSLTDWGSSPQVFTVMEEFCCINNKNYSPEATETWLLPQLQTL